MKRSYLSNLDIKSIVTKDGDTVGVATGGSPGNNSADITSSDLSKGGVKLPQQSQINTPVRKKRFYSGGLDRK